MLKAKNLRDSQLRYSSLSTSCTATAGILALLACGVCYMASKERKGEPLFAPKPASNPMRDDLEKA